MEGDRASARSVVLEGSTPMSSLGDTLGRALAAPIAHPLSSGVNAAIISRRHALALAKNHFQALRWLALPEDLAARFELPRTDLLAVMHRHCISVLKWNCHRNTSIASRAPGSLAGRVPDQRPTRRCLRSATRTYTNDFPSAIHSPPALRFVITFLKLQRPQ